MASPIELRGMSSCPHLGALDFRSQPTFGLATWSSPLWMAARPHVPCDEQRGGPIDNYHLGPRHFARHGLAVSHAEW